MNPDPREAHRRERNLVAVFSVGIGIVAATSFAGMLTVVVQPHAIVLPWPYRAFLFVLFGIAIILGLAAFRARLETLRLLAGVFVVAALIAYATLWPSLLLFGSTGRPGQLTWVLTTTALPVIAAAIAWGAVGGWTALGIIAVVVPALRALVGDASANGLVNDVHSIAFAMLFCVITTTLLESARLADAAASAAHLAVAERTEQLAREATQVRTHALVHDEVLATLGFAARATDEMRPVLAGRADEALRAIGSLADLPSSTARSTAGWSIEADALHHDRLAQMIRHVAGEHGVPVHVTDRGAGLRGDTIPAEAVAALLGALRQALVNARTHAGPDATVRVTAELGEDTARIVVEDDGHGFDPTVTNAGRMGVPVSILARLRTVRGGWASVDSTPDAGTRVVLVWSPPPAATSIPTRLRRTAAVAAESVWRSGRMSAFVTATLFAMLFLLATIASLRTGSWWPFVPAALLGTALAVLAPRAAARATPRSTIAALVLTTLAATSVLAPVVPSTLVYADVWFVPGTAFVLALLAFRGRPSSAAVGALLVAAIVVTGAVLRDLDPTQLTSAIVRLLFITSIAIALVLVDGTLNRRAERDRATALAAVADRAWAVTTRAELQVRSSALLVLVEPLLRRITTGDALTQAEEAECLALEGQLRDAYRSGRLAREPLVSAAANARRRGIDVILLDDVPDHAIPEATLSAIAIWLSAALDSASTERFAGRLLPAGRDAIAVAVDGDRTTSFGG